MFALKITTAQNASPATSYNIPTTFTNVSNVIIKIVLSAKIMSDTVRLASMDMHYTSLNKFVKFLSFLTVRALSMEDVKPAMRDIESILNSCAKTTVRSKTAIPAKMINPALNAKTASC